MRLTASRYSAASRILRANGDSFSGGGSGTFFRF
nr:MAG TPA: hypothetical protein [Caudoviricetes sp.]